MKNNSVAVPYFESFKLQESEIISYRIFTMILNLYIYIFNINTSVKFIKHLFCEVRGGHNVKTTISVSKLRNYRIQIKFCFR